MGRMRYGIALITLVLLAAAGIALAGEPDCSDYSTIPIEYLGRTPVMSGDAQVAWNYTYRVTSGTPAISHWAIFSCIESREDIIASSGREIIAVGYDGSTGWFGIKFDTGYSGGEERIVWFHLKKNCNVGPVDIGIKAGQCEQVYVGDIDGPACTCTEPPVPEPMSIALVGVGLAGLIGFTRFRKD